MQTISICSFIRAKNRVLSDRLVWSFDRDETNMKTSLFEQGRFKIEEMNARPWIRSECIRFFMANS